MRFSMKWTRGFLLAGLVFSAVPAKAGLLLDPYISYEMGKLDNTFAGGLGSLKYDVSGVGFGARVGYTLPIVFFALDYSMANGTAKLKEGTGFKDTDGTRSTLYALVGAKLPFIRAWAGYGFLNDLKMKEIQDGTGEATLKGDAIKVGVGFTGFPIISLNLEYIMSNYKKLKTAGGEEDISGPTFKDSKNNTVLLSVSAPFDI